MRGGCCSPPPSCSGSKRGVVDSRESNQGNGDDSPFESREVHPAFVHLRQVLIAKSRPDCLSNERRTHAGSSLQQQDPPIDRIFAILTKVLIRAILTDLRELSCNTLIGSMHYVTFFCLFVIDFHHICVMMVAYAPFQITPLPTTFLCPPQPKTADLAYSKWCGLRDSHRLRR